MNNRQFEVKQELLNSILEDWKKDNRTRAFERLCWFCNGLLASVRDLEQASFESRLTKEEKQP